MTTSTKSIGIVVEFININSILLPRCERLVTSALVKLPQNERVVFEARYLKSNDPQINIHVAHRLQTVEPLIVVMAAQIQLGVQVTVHSMPNIRAVISNTVGHETYEAIRKTVLSVLGKNATLLFENTLPQQSGLRVTSQTEVAIYADEVDVRHLRRIVERLTRQKYKVYLID